MNAPALSEDEDSPFAFSKLRESRESSCRRHREYNRQGFAPKLRLILRRIGTNGSCRQNEKVRRVGDIKANVEHFTP